MHLVSRCLPVLVCLGQPWVTPAVWASVNSQKCPGVLETLRGPKSCSPAGVGDPRGLCPQREGLLVRGDSPCVYTLS